MCRAASAAKRIISTAPIAKFGAMITFARGTPLPASCLAQRRERSNPVVPITTCTPARKQASAFSSAVSGRVKSTTTSALRQHLRERRSEQRIRAPHELHVLGALDRGAHRLAHASRRAGDRHPDHPAA